MADTCEYGEKTLGSKNGGISWLAAEPVSFSRRTVLHGVSKYINEIVNIRGGLDKNLTPMKYLSTKTKYKFS